MIYLARQSELNLLVWYIISYPRRRNKNKNEIKELKKVKMMDIYITYTLSLVNEKKRKIRKKKRVYVPEYNFYGSFTSAPQTGSSRCLPPTWQTSRPVHRLVLFHHHHHHHHRRRLQAPAPRNSDYLARAYLAGAAALPVAGLSCDSMEQKNLA